MLLLWCWCWVAAAAEPEAVAAEDAPVEEAVEAKAEDAPGEEAVKAQAEDADDPAEEEAAVEEAPTPTSPEDPAPRAGRTAKDGTLRPRLSVEESFRQRGVEIGTRYKLGLGIAAGFPPSATLRYMADPRRAVALHVGPTMVTTGLHLRLQYEQRVAELRTWGFGSLGLTWNIGLVAALVFGQEVSGRPIRPGITTGLGVELAFGVAPAAVFAEVSPVLYPLDLFPATRTSFLPAGLTVVVGARWYLDVGRRNRPEPAP